MSCPMPSATPTTLPTLAALLEDLAAIQSFDTERHRKALAELEAECARAHAQLLQDEAALAAVTPAFGEAAYEEWKSRAEAVADSRRAWGLLGVSERVLREGVEFSLFLARRTAAWERAYPAARGPHPF